MKRQPFILVALTALLLAPPAILHAGEQEAVEQRARVIMQAATADFGRLNGGSPMHYWIAQRLFERGEKEKALAIVKSGMKSARAFIEKREREHHNNIGYNGFIYWASLNCYVHWRREFDKELLDDYRYVFTHAHNYKGTTGNLSMIHTLALYLADHIWGAENLPKDGNYGARGPAAVKWLNDRIERVARFGSGEFASRPYMIYNVGTLLTLNNEFVDEALRKKAAMAYEMSIAHAAGTWLRGHWAVPSGRSYPDHLTQQPSGSAALLWTYFGGVAPRLDAGSAAIFSAAEQFRPSPLIVQAATDRSRPYVCRSRFDGDKQFQTTFMNKTYAVFSAAVLPGSGVWGQTYPYGVMWDEPAADKGSHLWLTVPAEDGKKLGLHTHGINSRHVQFAQHRGSLLLVATRLDSSSDKYPYVLGCVPGGWRAMTDESSAAGRMFLHYGSVLIALAATEKFNLQDSEFRIRGDNVAVGLETALPGDFPGETPAAQLAAFRAAVLKKSQLAITGATGTFADRDGVVIERTFDGDTRINGERVVYGTWPLLENPWMRQEFGGNLTVTDGKSNRVYDVTNWTITESSRE